MEGDVINPVRRITPAGMGSPCAVWSRRRFVGEGLALMAAAPLIARAGVGPPVDGPLDPSVGSAPAGAPADGTGSGSVRFAGARDDRLTTEVLIDGRGPFHFLVDTGAERTLIAQDVAEQLGLPLGRKVMVEGITRGEPALLAAVRTLTMGSLVCRGLEVPVLPHAMLRVDGYLGLDVLDRHRVIFDFSARTLTVTRPQGFFAALWAGADEAVVRTLGSSGRLRASNCLVDGVRAAAFIDSGAEVSVSNPALYAALQRRAPTRLIVNGPVSLYGVTGGTITGLATNVDEIRVGALQLTYTPLVVAGLQVFNQWGLSRAPALLLGMDCLRRFTRVSVDYARKELRFEVASAEITSRLREASLPPPLTG